MSFYCLLITDLYSEDSPAANSKELSPECWVIGRFSRSSFVECASWMYLNDLVEWSSIPIAQVIVVTV